MKSIILALVTLSSLSLANAAPMQRINLNIATVVTLSDVKANSLALDISYPGLGDRDESLCNIEIRADHLTNPIGDLLKGVEIEGLFGRGTKNVIVRGTRTLEIELIKNTYVDGVVLKTKGRFVAEVGDP